jgi:N-methylhydantoinase A
VSSARSRASSDALCARTIESPRWPLASVASAAGGGTTPARKSVRPVYFEGAYRDTPVYDRAVLPPGYRLEGPAVVEEFGSTTVVFPGQSLDVDPHGILIIRPAATSGGTR